jgi:DNA polymerase III psi subunit
MSPYRLINGWLLRHPSVIHGMEAITLIAFWSLAIVTERTPSYMYAVLWTVLILAIRPTQRALRRRTGR